MPFDKSFRQHWGAAGYRTDVGSAATGLPPPANLIRLYHLCSSEHAIANIAMGRLKVARVNDLNDPFELMALNFKFGQVRQVVREFKQELDIQKGLLCFSEDWTSPVMWSHYAAKHRGICLGFDVLRTSVQTVQYEDKRLRAELGESDDPFGLTPELQDILRRTKCHQWSYEEERRMFVELADAKQEGKLHFWPFDKELQLAEVILGERCELSLDEVRELVGKHYPRARTFRARLAFQHFKVVPKESTVP